MKLLMRDEAKGREHTIFVTIFSALMVMLAIVVMLMASATAVSGVTLQLDKNAVDILDKQVENRAGYNSGPAPAGTGTDGSFDLHQ